MPDLNGAIYVSCFFIVRVTWSIMLQPTIRSHIEPWRFSMQPLTPEVYVLRHLSLRTEKAYTRWLRGMLPEDSGAGAWTAGRSASDAFGRPTNPTGKRCT